MHDDFELIITSSPTIELKFFSVRDLSLLRASSPKLFTKLWSLINGPSHKHTRSSYHRTIIALLLFPQRWFCFLIFCSLWVFHSSKLIIILQSLLSYCFHSAVFLQSFLTMQWFLNECNRILIHFQKPELSRKFSNRKIIILRSKWFRVVSASRVSEQLRSAENIFRLDTRDVLRSPLGKDYGEALSLFAFLSSWRDSLLRLQLKAFSCASHIS